MAREKKRRPLSAYSEAGQLPGELREKVRHVLRVRAAKLRQMRGLGWSFAEITEATGLTYRQARYALQLGKRHAQAD